MISDWAGDYKEEKYSVNRGGKNDGSYSTSYEDKKILKQDDIFGLQEKGEAVHFVKGRYMRAKVEGARYYRIKDLNKISEQCKQYNEEKEN